MDLLINIKKHIKLITLIIGFTLFHLITSITLNLGDDEAYYWLWSKHLALSYFDHPPLIAYLIALSTHAFGDTVFGVRFFNLALMPALSLIIYKLSLNIYKSVQVALFTVFSFNIIPVFFLGCLLITPDTPLLFFYILGLYLFIKLLNTSNYKYWYLLGVITGLGMLSKYIMVFTYIAIFVSLLQDKKNWHWFKSIHLYLAFAISILIFTPVLWWNYKHEWVSFVFQFYSRHTHSLNLNFFDFGTFIGSQLLIISPIFFILLIYYGFKAIYNPALRVLAIFGLLPLFAFTLVSLTTQSRTNWAIISYVPLLIISIPYCYKHYKTFISAVIISLILSVIIIIQAYYPILKIKPLKNDPTTDFYGWPEVALEVKDILAKSPDYFIFSSVYQLSSQLTFALKGLNIDKEVYTLTASIQGPRFWEDESVLFGKNALFITNSLFSTDPTSRYNCDNWSLYKTIPIIRANITYRTVEIYQCLNYKGIKY